MIQKPDELLKDGVPINRIIDFIKGNDEGPTLIFFAGIHGNEPAGVVGLQKVFKELREQAFSVKGSIYGLAGNLNALQKQIRYEDEDLNRIWNTTKLDKIKSYKKLELHQEEKEMLDLHEVLLKLLNTENPPFYFIDLHTTSGETTPFIVMNDSLLNRRFVLNYPLPKVLGIEEYLHGALLSFINEMGYVSFGFESGQHEQYEAITNNVNFIHYTLMLTSSITASKSWESVVKRAMDTISAISTDFFEITYEHHLKATDSFQMAPGFLNFQRIKKGIKIADFNGEPVIANKATQIFMPLYQSQGSEGFYLIKPTPRIYLWISKYFRRLRLDNILTILPGLNWKSNERKELVVNTRIAKYISKSFFHLMGYRVRRGEDSYLILKSRESASRYSEYPSSWK